MFKARVFLFADDIGCLFAFNFHIPTFKSISCLITYKATKNDVGELQITARSNLIFMEVKAVSSDKKTIRLGAFQAESYFQRTTLHTFAWENRVGGFSHKIEDKQALAWAGCQFASHR